MHEVNTEECKKIIEELQRNLTLENEKEKKCMNDIYETVSEQSKASSIKSSLETYQNEIIKVSECLKNAMPTWEEKILCNTIVSF